MWDDIPTQTPDASSLFNSSVLYEKYRPKTVDDIVLPDYLKDKVKSYLTNGGKSLPHLGLFSRLPGTGKSSLAKVIVNELKAEALWINASMDRGLDVLRSRIQTFASQCGLRDTVKVVVMDEFDNFTKEGQAAFRGLVDEFGQNTRFIFTGNYRENIIEPLLDRMEVWDFNQFGPSQIAKPILERLEFILKSEDVKYQREDVLLVIKNNFPKIRKMIGDLSAGIQETEEGRVFNYAFIGQSDKLAQLLILMKQRDIQKVKSVCYGLGSVDHIFSYFSEKIEELFSENQEAMVNGIIVLAKYQSYHSSAKDKQLNAVACCFELMKLL